MLPRSSIFIKVIIVITLLVSIFSFSIYSFVIPKIENHINLLERNNAKEILNGIKNITTHVYEDIEEYRKIALKKHKDELKNLTDTVWSIIDTKYEQSNPKNIGIVLENRAKEFEQNLLNFYNQNKNNMTQEQLKQAIKNYINIYRYNNGIGYFWINDFTPTMILHPIVKSLNGKYLGDYKDKDGVYLFNKMVKICKTNSSGVVKYKWLNPKSNKIEDKISYVFTFKPFNWIIGTGEYISVLQKQLQQEVIDLVKNLRYNKTNYFFIYDYNNIAISHPYIQGKDMTNIKDTKGNLIVPPFIKIAREKGEGFYTYWWQKDSQHGESYKKLTYVKDFPNWKMVVATGIFIDDIEKDIIERKKKVFKHLQKIISTKKIGNTGYCYVFDKNSIMLIHPDKSLIGKPFSHLKDPLSNRSLFEELVKASKTESKQLRYKWNKPTDLKHYIYDKIAWVEYIPQFDIYIAASAYLDDLNRSSKEAKQSIIYISIIILLITFILGIILLRFLLQPLQDLSNITKQVTKGDYSIRTNIDQQDEIGVLANSFDNMLDTVEDLINNLDLKIEVRTQELLKANKKIESIHEHTKESIKYAALIQTAILPSDKLFDIYFKDSFVIWEPKDTVGGDIYLFDELRDNDECLFMVIDCTGHGVPGAFVTMIVKAVEREIVSKIKEDKEMDVSPAWIMSYFNKTIKKLLRQETPNSKSNAGFDGAIIYYNRKKQILKFAGALTPLFYIDLDNNLNIVKGSKYSVGYKKSDPDYIYKEDIIEVEEGMKFYITTDGYLDQNGGEKDFPFGKKRFTKTIEEFYTMPMQEQKIAFVKTLQKYESLIENNERNDDITVIGFEIDTKSTSPDIILEYEGILTQSIISHNIDILEHTISNLSIMAKLSTVVIELTQNMMNYSKSHDLHSTDIRPAGYIKVLKTYDGKYIVQTKNILSVKDKETIEPRLNEIKSLDTKGIKQRYKELRRSGINTHSKGGGVGFYEIAKLVSTINYKFEAINENKLYFYFETILKFKNNGSIKECNN